MKIVTIMYVSAILMYLILGYLGSVIAIKQFKSDHPTAVFTKRTVAERISALIRLMIFALCPIVNLLLAFVVALLWDDYVEQCYDKCEELCERY